MLPRMMEAAGVTEELKAHDPMRWVGLMNTLKAQVEEMILKEIVFEYIYRPISVLYSSSYRLFETPHERSFSIALVII